MLEERIQFNIRLPAELVKKLKYEARMSGLSTNEYCESLLVNSKSDQADAIHIDAGHDYMWNDELGEVIGWGSKGS